MIRMRLGGMAVLLMGLLILLRAPEVLGACTGSSPTWTSTADYASVNTCVTGATAGDTINVGAGSATWTSQLVITKGLNLIGAGIGQTIITNGAAQTLVYFNPSNYALNTPIRISGFTFDANNLGTILQLSHAKDQPFQIQTKARIDHIRFTGSTSNSYQAIKNFSVWGVTDHNTIDNMTYPFRHDGDGGTNHFTWWDALVGLVYGGNENTMYYEDNTIDIPAGSNVLADCNSTGRYTMRYNTITLHGASYPVFDQHGEASTVGGNAAYEACFGLEAYGNKLITDSGTFETRLGDQRAGKWLVFNNAKTGSGGLTFQAREEANGDHPTTNSQPSYVSDSYYWNNRQGGLAGTLVTAINIPYTQIQTYGPAAGRGVPQLNKDLWMQGTSFDGTAGVGAGTLAARPVTCTPGVGYWATDQSVTDLTGMVGVSPPTPISGTLYKCTAPDTWTAYYTPLTYPHPLAATGGGGSSADHVTITTDPATCTGGTPCTTQPVVTAQKPDGSTDTSFTGAITLAIASGPTGAVCIATTNPLNATSGVASFAGFQCDLIGNYVIRATASGLTSDDSIQFTVTLGAPTQLRFIIQPNNGIAGSTLTQQPAVGSYDPGNNLVTTATDSVTITLDTCTGLSVTTNPLTETSGVAQFTGVTISTAGTGCTLTASATGRTPAISVTFDISSIPGASAPGQPSHTGEPASYNVVFTAGTKLKLTINASGGEGTQGPLTLSNFNLLIRCGQSNGGATITVDESEPEIALTFLGGSQYEMTIGDNQGIGSVLWENCKYWVEGTGDGIGQLASDQTTVRSVSATADPTGVTTLLTRIPGTVQPQSGDAYARLGAPTGASIAADILGVQLDTDNLQTRLPAALVSGRILALADALSAAALEQLSDYVAKCNLSGTPTTTAFTVTGCTDKEGNAITLAANKWVGAMVKADTVAATRCNVQDEAVMIGSMTAGGAATVRVSFAGAQWTVAPDIANCFLKVLP